MCGVSRREAIHSLGLAAAAGFSGGCGPVLAASGQKNPEDTAKDKTGAIPSSGVQAADWTYYALDPDAVAAQVYALYPGGGCMYALFAGTMRCLARIRAEPYLSFPFHMLQYGGGGIGHSGSVCGAVNGGAAVIGLFERDRQRLDSLIGRLLSWFETTELPIYRPTGSEGSPPCAKSVSESVLCHVSMNRWCKASGFKTDSPERKERCRRLTVDVAVKPVELLNANLREPYKVSAQESQSKSCVLCHGEKRDTVSNLPCKTANRRQARTPSITTQGWRVSSFGRRASPPAK